MKPLSISVVIPTFNSAGLVVEAVQSVLAQTLQPAEVIVVDDGSTDDTHARVGAFAAPVRYVYQENQGVSAARNLGVRHAREDYVAFLDADDVWHPRKLEIQSEVLAGRPDLAILGTDIFDWPASKLPEVCAAPSDVLVVIPLRRLLVKNYLGTSTLVARRDLLNRAGLFDRSLQGPEDYDLWLRVAEIAPVANVKLPLTGYRSVAGSVSRQVIRMYRDMGTILRKLDERDAWRGDWLLRRKAHSYCDYSTAYMYAEAGDRGTAIGLLLRSLAGYPLPYRSDEVRMPFARPRLLLATLRGAAYAAPAAPLSSDRLTPTGCRS